MTNADKSTGLNLSSLWRFLDHEDQREEGRDKDQEAQVQRFLRPAMYGVNRNSIGRVRPSNGLQMPTFANRLKANDDRDKDGDPAKQPKRLPRTQMRDQSNDAEDLYAMPNKSRKNENKAQQDPRDRSKESNPRSYSLSKKQQANDNSKTKTTTPSSNNHNNNDYFIEPSTALFKRYDPGSILSSASGGVDHVPAIYHDGGRNGRIVEEVDEDNVVYAQTVKSSSSSRTSLWRKSTEGGGGRGRCSKRVVLAVALAVALVAAAVVAIAVAVSVKKNDSGNADKVSSQNSSTENVTTGRNSTGTVNPTYSHNRSSNTRQDPVAGTSTFAVFETYSNRVTVPASTETGTGRSSTQDTRTDTTPTAAGGQSVTDHRTTFSGAATTRAQGSSARASSAERQTDIRSNSSLKYGQSTTATLTSPSTSRKIVPSTVTSQETSSSSSLSSSSSAAAAATSGSQTDGFSKDANSSLVVANVTAAASEQRP